MSYGVVQGTGVVAAAGGAIIAGTGTANGAVSFANSNGVTFGVSGNTVTATVNPGPAAGIGGIIAGTQTLTSQSLNFVNSNGVSFGLSNSTNLTASINAPGTGTTFAGANLSGSMTLNTAGLNLSLSATGPGAGVGTTFAGTNVSGSMTLNTAGLNLALSAGGGTGGGFTGINVSVAGQTSVGGIQTLNFAQANGVSFSFNTANFNLYAQAPPMSISGNTSGTLALLNTGTFILAGGPNITLSQVLNSITISGATVAGQPVNFSAGTTSSNLGSVVFSNSPTVSFGLNGATITASAVGGTGGGGATAGTAFATGNTTQNTSATYPFSSIVVSGDGIISAGFTNNTLVISGPQTVAFTQLSVGMSTLGNTTGSTGMATAQLALAGGSGITLSGSTSGGSMTITISGGAGGGGASSGGIYASSQTTGAASSSTYALASLSIVGAGAMSVGLSNGSLLMSAPGTSSLVGTSGVSISTGGATISVQPTPVSRTIWPEGNLTSVTAPGNASMSIQYWPCANLISASRMDALFSISMGSSATAATAALALSAYGIVYTRNGSTLSSVASGSTQSTYSFASNNSGATQLQTGAVRPISVPMNIVATPGEYFVGFNLVTATSSVGTATTSFAPGISVMGGNALQTALNYAEMGSQTANTTNLYPAMGVRSAATTGVPTTLALSDINQTGSALSAANFGFVLRNL